ncbi:MAG TPA: hypothetical protein VKE69_09795 [Planctomycetota bacterium]|nr:hypothetical protein [Planctomycetota bacterium]
MPPIAPREAARRLTHAGVGLGALLLRWISWPAALGCCVAGIVLNHAILPRTTPGLFRPGESRFTGIRAYPIAVLLLVILFPMRTAAGAWAILAFGDAAAALFGRAWGKAKLPWNRDKSWIGMLAFVAAATIGGTLVYAFVETRTDRTVGLFGEIHALLGKRPWLDWVNGHFWFWSDGGDYLAGPTSFAYGLRRDVWLAVALASAAAAFVETIRMRLDDNFRIALAAGLVLLALDPFVVGAQRSY